MSHSALPRLYDPDEGPSLEELEGMVREGSACVECFETWPTPAQTPPAICETCANLYRTKVLDSLGYTLRRDRGKNRKAWADTNRAKKNARKAQ